MIIVAHFYSIETEPHEKVKWWSDGNWSQASHIRNSLLCVLLCSNASRAEWSAHQSAPIRVSAVQICANFSLQGAGGSRKSSTPRYRWFSRA